MATLTLVIVFILVLLYGCTSINVNVASDGGKTNRVGYESNKDEQAYNATEVESNVAGIDKSKRAKITQHATTMKKELKQENKND